MRIASLFAGAVMAVGMMAAAVPSEAAPLAHFGAKSDIVTQVRDDDRGMRRRGPGDDDHGMHRRRHGDDDRGWNWRRRHHGDSCRGARFDCAERFGWGSWRFRRCVDRHGC